MRSRLFQRQSCGFTLIELVTAILIMTIGVVAFYLAFVYGQEIVQQQELRLKALRKARSDLIMLSEYVKANPNNVRNWRSYEYPLDVFSDGSTRVTAEVEWVVGDMKSETTYGPSVARRELDVIVWWDSNGDGRIRKTEDNAVRLSNDVWFRAN